MRACYSVGLRMVKTLLYFYLIKGPQVVEKRLIYGSAPALLILGVV